jgi:hypothetical protein
MSKPRGICAFCGLPNALSKGHIWPDSFGAILPSDAKYHEQRVGWFHSFESQIPGPKKWERIGTGPLQKRRPRNTCIKCNGGWMSIIEETALPVVRPLILAERTTLETGSMSSLAALLALVSIRIELTARPMRTIPQADIQHLMNTGRPNEKWRVWVARHSGTDLKDYSYRYTAMQVLSKPTSIYGPEHCNTHVTTLVVGQLYAHILFSTVWPDFPGYQGISLTQIWPANDLHIRSDFLPVMPEEEGIEVPETISRLGKPGAI